MATVWASMRSGQLASSLLVIAVVHLSAPLALAEQPHEHGAHRTLTDSRMVLPSAEHLWRVLSLADYNTRIVLAGATLLGMCAGVVGSFMLLRRRSLVGDVVSHAALPGIGVAFLAAEAISPGSGRSTPVLLAGAVAAGLLGVATATAIRRFTRIKEDAALAVVLSVFFGAGIALFTLIQGTPSGNAAGLQGYIYGRTANLVAADVELILIASVATLLVCLLLFKELSLLCFDEQYAASQGWPATGLDLALMALVVGVTVIGLQSVGLLLVVALLITPAASARFWTDRLSTLAWVSAAIGGASAAIGVLASALMPRLAAGAVIVLTGALFFVASLIFGSRRGVLLRWLEHRRLAERIGRTDLLRAFFEHVEPHYATDGLPGLAGHTVSLANLVSQRAWTPARVSRLLRQAVFAGLVRTVSPGAWRLTGEGAQEALRATRNHRLWEQYLIAHADIAPSRVDRDADEIEHVLEPALVDELEKLLAEEFPHLGVLPSSPHAVTPPAG